MNTLDAIRNKIRLLEGDIAALKRVEQLLSEQTPQAPQLTITALESSLSVQSRRIKELASDFECTEGEIRQIILNSTTMVIGKRGWVHIRGVSQPMPLNNLVIQGEQAMATGTRTGSNEPA